MKFFFADLFGNKRKYNQQRLIVTMDDSVHNITEGGEFLDDAIRMKEQSFASARTEENVSAGTPKDWWL